MLATNLKRKAGDFVSQATTLVHVDHSVEEALQKIRTQHIDGKIIYFYAIDDLGELKGVVSTRNLLLNPPHTKIRSIMEDRLICVSEEETLQKAMEALSKHRLLAIPVIDDKKRLKGVLDIQIYLDESLDLKQKKQDIFQLLGLKIEDSHASFWQIYRTRMPWIFCNMIGGIACAVISRIFELVLSKILLLAFFIPLVLTLSESISMQSMSYSLQLLHNQHLGWKKILSSIYADAKVVLFLAFTSAVVVGAISLFWGNGLLPAFAIGSGIAISVTISASIGASVPLLLHAKKLDPKVAAGPVILTIADIITTTIYLSLATFLLV